MTELYIIGAGGHGAVVADIALACGYTIVGFIDDNFCCQGTTVLYWSVLGGRGVIPAGSFVAIAIGNNAMRTRVFHELQHTGYQLPMLIHPSATVSSFAAIGPGTVVMPQVVVNARSRIGDGCILNTACSVDHDCSIGDFVHLAPGARLAGDISVGSGTLIGIGSCLHPGITIGQEAVIGAGSVVLRDIADRCTAYGNPARVRLLGG